MRTGSVLVFDDQHETWDQGSAVPFRLGPWRVEPAACELSDGDTMVRLRPKLMDLLLVFAARPGEVLSKQVLLDLVWPDVTVVDHGSTITELSREDEAERPADR